LIGRPAFHNYCLDVFYLINLLLREIFNVAASPLPQKMPLYRIGWASVSLSGLENAQQG
jgi:hypothetical protein